MTQKNDYYALIEFLRAVIEHLDDYEGKSISLPKKDLPYFKDIVHEAVGDIVFRLYCIDRIINPELVDEGFKIEVEFDEN